MTRATGVAGRGIARVTPERVKGIVLDAPVLGSLTEAEAGSLAIFAGGTERAARRAEPVLVALGRG